MLLAFPLGVIAAVKKGTAFDTLANVVAVLGQSLPQFWVGIVLIQVFAVHLRWLPVAGNGSVWHYVLPAFTLGWFVVAGMMRLLRSSMLDILGSEFVKLARIKGVPGGRVIWKHALRNAFIPVLTFGAIYLAILITGAILVETVFAWPGIGQLIYQGIVFRDFPVVQAVVLLTAGIVMCGESAGGYHICLSGSTYSLWLRPTWLPVNYSEQNPLKRPVRWRLAALRRAPVMPLGIIIMLVLTALLAECLNALLPDRHLTA